MKEEKLCNREAVVGAVAWMRRRWWRRSEGGADARVRRRRRSSSTTGFTHSLTENKKKVTLTTEVGWPGCAPSGPSRRLSLILTLSMASCYPLSSLETGIPLSTYPFTPLCPLPHCSVAWLLPTRGYNVTKQSAIDIILPLQLCDLQLK